MYDPAGHLIGEYDASGGLIQETVWVGDIPVAVFKSNGTTVVPYYVYSDNLNTPRAITNTAGQLVWRWDGEPFGATTADENPSSLGQFTYGLRFPGQYFDAETGYHQNRWRDYDPKMGRYVQSDPIGLAGGLNSYLYASASPLSRTDKDGLVDVNNFSPVLDPWMWWRARRINSKDYFSYAGHGNHLIVERQSIFGGGVLDASQIAEDIRRSPNWGNRPILLLACHSGQDNPGTGSIAQQVANKLKVPVLGYPDYAWFQNSGGLPRNQDAVREKDGSYTPSGPVTAPIWFQPK